MEKIGWLTARQLRRKGRRRERHEEPFEGLERVAYRRAVPRSRKAVVIGATKTVVSKAGVKFMDLLERGNRNINRKHPKGIDTDFVFGKGGLRRF